ncbi:MAG: Na/Pi cotransporter family protein [Clostridia bacterium]|nr:Na/Pi cotransporter family protein [Clostridia bacterium]
MGIIEIVSLAGGLALLLYGMQIMGNGLEKMSGSHLERILERLTSNRFFAFLLGIGVTAIIQSSSATTVMVVGFVNSGIMKLSQAVGIIMGANIGTTMTAWILSLTGIQGDNIVLELLKPTSLAPIAAFIGIVLFLFVKKRNAKDLGVILMGFALLLYGMDVMSSAVEPLKNEQWFADLLILFSNPFLGVLVGALLTAIIQSSSASVGILQAMSAAGLISFSAAIPIICGQNIGTCATALLSTGGTNRNARRTAVIHFLFNVIGTTAFLVVFYIVKAFVAMPFLEGMATPANIAAVHTVFNVFATALLFPFANLLVKLSGKIVPEKSTKHTKKEQNTFAMLDERLLATPGFAVERCHRLTIRMAELATETMLDALDLLQNYDAKLAKKVMDQEGEADVYEDRLGEYLVKISGHDLTDHDTQTVSLMLASIGDFERISDHAANLVEAAEEMHSKGITFSDDAKDEIMVLSGALREILHKATAAFSSRDHALAIAIEPLEEVIDDIRDELKARHIVRLREGRCTIELGFILSDILTNCERVADHCSNIAGAILSSEPGSAMAHAVLSELHKADESFTSEYTRLHNEYFSRINLQK